MMHRSVHPWIFMLLILPFGMIAGYLTVTVAYLLTNSGIAVEDVAALIALSFVPHTWKFLWAPIVDSTLSRKYWYMIGCVITALGIAAIGATPATRGGMAVLTVVAVIANTAVTLLGMSVESLMAHSTPDDVKGRAGGWFQAGNLGGTGLGGGAGLWIAQNSSKPWIAGAVLALICLLCCSALFFVEDHCARPHQNIVKNLKSVVVDVWDTAKSRSGWVALFLCFLPIGSGAAGGLWSSVAGDWQASANVVALVTGIFGGLVSASGCIAGGWICDRMNRKHAYILFGVLQAFCAIAMATASRSENNYVIYTMLYAFITGLTYAGFSAFVLEAMGLGAAATKFSLFSSLSNMPIVLMTAVDGWSYGRWGSSGMLFLEAALVGVGILVFFGVLALSSIRSKTPAPELVLDTSSLATAE